MKITKTRLKQIIKEELENLMEEDNIMVAVKLGEDGKEKTIELNGENLRAAVSRGHDNDFDYNARMIKDQISRGITSGMTSIDRYPGGSSDRVYWRLVK
jgi:hypothetical protein